MTHLHRDVTITRPPDEVFAHLTDFDQRARWEAGVLAARQSPTGAVRAGTKVFKTRREFGRRVVTTVAVTDYQPERRRLSERVVDGALRGTTVTWSVSTLGRLAQVRVEVELHLAGLSKPLAPWLIWRTRAELARSLQRLKDALERQAETSVPAMGTDQPAAEGAV
jgi:carbon monoxide dehydrogenase subunit G